jgi:hypothetical protein
MKLLKIKRFCCFGPFPKQQQNIYIPIYTIKARTLFKSHFLWNHLFHNIICCGSQKHVQRCTWKPKTFLVKSFVSLYTYHLKFIDICLRKPPNIVNKQATYMVSSSRNVTLLLMCLILVSVTGFVSASFLQRKRTIITMYNEVDEGKDLNITCDSGDDHLGLQSIKLTKRHLHVQL